MKIEIEITDEKLVYKCVGHEPYRFSWEKTTCIDDFIRFGKIIEMIDECFAVKVGHGDVSEILYKFRDRDEGTN